MIIHEQDWHTILSFIHIVDYLTVPFIEKSFYLTVKTPTIISYSAACISVIYSALQLLPLSGSNTTHHGSMCCEKIENTPQPSDSPSVWDKMGLPPSPLRHKISYLILWPPVVYSVLQKTLVVEQ